VNYAKRLILAEDDFQYTNLSYETALKVDAIRQGRRVGIEAALPPGSEPRSGDWYWGWEKAMEHVQQRKHAQAMAEEQEHLRRLKAETFAQIPHGAESTPQHNLELRTKWAKHYQVQHAEETKDQVIKAAMQKAVHAHRNGDWAAAVQAFDVAAVMMPAAVGPLYGAGHALWQAGDIAGAVKQFAAAIEVDPEPSADKASRKPWNEQPPSSWAGKEL